MINLVVILVCYLHILIANASVTAAQGQELILACGNTGCGKSTLITSLVFGTDKLEEVKVPEVRRLPNGKEKTFYTKFID